MRRKNQHRITAPDRAVIDARDLKKLGHSCSTIAAAINQTYGTSVTRRTIYDWVTGKTRTKVDA